MRADALVNAMADDLTAGLVPFIVVATGTVFLTHARLGARDAIRVSVGQTMTERRHVEGLWNLLDSLA